MWFKFSGMRFSALILFSVALFFGGAGRLYAIIFLETGDPQHNTTTPGDNSGWQYEGKFNSFLGVPIAPFYFITAKHIGGDVGNILYFHGDNYTTIAVHASPSTDLQIWEVDHAKPFPTYAPLSSGAEVLGTKVTVMGRGTQRGDEVFVGSEPKGWKWGAGDDVQRWGWNNVSSFPNGGQLLYCAFNKPGIGNECHLSVGDSGGGVFVEEGGLWRLAGINYAVDGPFRTDSAGPEFNAVLYDAGGLEYKNGEVWTPIAEQPYNIASGFYSSRISASLSWISGITGQGAGTLASEDYTAWQTLYFTPDQISTPETTGAMADFDGDGIGNLLEFALNLDPTYSERASMQPGTGLRGLPVVRVENISGTNHMTIEFVRRTAGSGAGLTYSGQFSSDLVDWGAVGTESVVVAINPRWERVKIVDTVATTAAVKRFARLKVVLAE